MLGKKSSVAPILAFLKENDVSKYSYNTYLYQNKIMVVHVPQAQNQLFFLGGGGGWEGWGEGGGLERESGQQAAAVPFPPSGEFKKV